MTKLIQTAFVLSFASLAFAGPKLAKDLPSSTSTASINVIVQFRTPPTKDELQQIQAYGQLKKLFNSITGAYLTVKPSAFASLEADPNVTYVSPDRNVAGALEYAEPTVNANIALQYGFDGTGVGVAVIDSGILSSHPDLKTSSGSPRVVYAQDFTGTGGSGDAYGHGTHVAGIIGGNGAQSSGNSATFTFRGIAPKSTLIDLRVLDANGQGTDSMVISAIDQAIALKGTYNIRVINLSLGRQVQERYTLDPLCQAVERAWKAGIVFVVAAGNNGRDNSMGTNGYSTIAAPGNDPYVITVGSMKDMSTALRADDNIASYSSKGPTLYDRFVKPDLVAPGNSIISTLAANSTIVTKYPSNSVPVSYYKNGTSNSSYWYFRLSGTSMATPMVSGAAALLIQKNSTLSPDTVKARLMKTATKNFPATSIVTDPTTGITYTSQYD